MPDINETERTRTRVGQAQMPHVSDAPQISPAMPGEGVASTWPSRVSWGAILAGLVVALVTQLLLNLIGIAVGAGSFARLFSGGESAATVSTSAGIWFVISGILAALVGGYAAGMFSGAQNESNAGWHGLTTWALTVLLFTYLLSSAASGILGGLGSAAKSTAQAALPVLTQVTDPFSSIEQQLRSATSGNDPAALRDAAIVAVRAVVTGDQQQMAEARERAAQAIAHSENIAVEDARKQVQNYEQQYRQILAEAKEQAKEAADTAAKATSRAALLGAISLVLGGLAGWIGGRAAVGGEQSLRDRIATATGRTTRR
jgi:hypothetical protein